MKVDDKVVLKKMKENENNTFWKNRDIDYESVGTIIYLTRDINNPTYIEVLWGNGSTTVCRSRCLKPYKDKNIPLPNLKFKRRGTK